MIYLSVSFGLLLHFLLWGVGAALLVTPARWRSFWPVWIAPCGIALQSAVVWIGVHTTLAGTNAYAWAAELIPVALLALGLHRRGALRSGRELRRFAGVGILMAVCLLLLTLPLSRVSKVLTTASIGSCDAADYAAGARVFQEFSRNDRSGFIGLTEVAGVGSTDNFFDFWVKLNHFTPSALMAFNGTIFALQPHEVAGLLTVVLLVTVLPMVYWLARSTAGLGRGASGWLTLLYGISPITWYATYHVAPGQILAAQAIALLTWGAIALWKEPESRRAGLAYAGLLMVGFGIIWGAYNFIVIVCLVPAVGCVGGWAMAGREWGRFLRWLGWLVLPLAVSGFFYFERATGLVERFHLFQKYDFGWKIAGLWPEGWLGMVDGRGPRPLGEFSGPISWVLGTLVVLLPITAALLARSKRPKQAWQAAAFFLPVMAGYGYLQWRGVMLDNNASYDAYKLFSVFYPVLLLALCHWLVWLKARSSLLRVLALGMMVVVTGFNLRAAYLFSERVESTLLVVDKDIVAISEVETLDQVHSMNMMVQDFWARLWANSFMLRKAQYFPTHTYEGRIDTPLRGEWDFNGGILQVKVPGPDCKVVNNRFSLVRTSSRYFLRARLGEGWYGTERLRARQTVLWNWTKGEAAIELENPQNRPLKVTLRFMARSLIKRDLQVWIDGRHLRTMQLDTTLAPLSIPPIAVPPGKITIWLRSSQPPTRADEHDERLLGFAAYAIVVDVRPDDALIEY